MAKFKGNNSDDAIIGTALDDDIDGKHGNDTLSGLGGNDNIRGQHGMDDISGGDGNDTLIGHHDSDTVHGGDGDDVVFGDVGGNGSGSSYWNSSDGPGDGDSSDDLVDGGAGNDYVFGGGGNDEAIYDLTENAGAMDYYAGGSGIDTLTLTMTLSDWFRIEVQNDIAAFLNFVAVNTDPLTGEANGQGFDFAAFGLTAREFEDMRVFVDGVELSPEDDPVTANDDSASLTEDDGDTALSNVLTNDVVPDLVYQVALVSGPAKGILTFNEGLPGAPDGSFSYDPNGEFEYLALGESEDVTFVYEVTDANRDTDQATVTITVDGVNDDPVSLDLPEVANEADGRFYTIRLDDQVSDVDGDNLTFSFVNISRDNTVIPFRVFGDDNEFIQIDVAALGLDTNESLNTQFQYLVSDGNGGSDTGIVPLTINGNDDPPPPTPAAPVASALEVSADEDDPYIEIQISDLGTDANGDPLLVTALTGTLFDVFSSQDIEFIQGNGIIRINPRQFFIQEGEPVDPAAAGDGVLSGGEEASLTLNFTIADPGGLSDSNVITLNLTGVDPDTTPTNAAPTAANIITPPDETPQTDPFSGAIVPSDIITGDSGAAPIVIDLDNYVSDPDGPDPLTIAIIGDLISTDPTTGVQTIAGVVIGTNEATGESITAQVLFDPVSNELTIPLDTFPLADGESALGTLQYSVFDGEDTSLGTVAFNYVNPGEAPPNDRVLDFEPFADSEDATIVLDTLRPAAGDNVGETYEGFLFQGQAAVIETDELGSGRGAETGILNGQTTDGGDNVLLAGPARTTVEVPVLDETDAPLEEPLLDERGNPVLDETGAPVMVPVTETLTLTDPFALLAPGMTFGIGGTVSGSFVTDAFDLDKLSLNVAEGNNVVVTITTWELETVPDGFAFSTSLVEVDTFAFLVSASTPATMLDFNTAFEDDADTIAALIGSDPVPANTNTAGFDDIHAVSFVSDNGSPIVIDDILVTL